MTLSFFITLVLAASPAPFARDLVFDVPHALEEVKVPGRLDALGVPVQLKAVHSGDSAVVLADYFRKMYLKAGLFIAPRGSLTDIGVPQVTGLDPDTKITYVAILQPNADGTTTVILGKARFAERKDPSSATAIAPIFPAAKDIVHSSMEAAATLSYTVAAKPAEVVTFYRDVLKGDGYGEVGPGLFARNDRQLRIQMSPMKTGETHVTIVGQFARGESP